MDDLPFLSVTSAASFLTLLAHGYFSATLLIVKNKMNTGTSTNHAANGMQRTVWGCWLRDRREALGLSQEALAVQVEDRIRHALQTEGEAMSALHIKSTKACAGFAISRFENGSRVPAHRHTHLLLLWVLLRLGAVITVDDANRWLESGAQGWLTAREQAVLFAL